MKRWPPSVTEPPVKLRSMQLRMCALQDLSSELVQMIIRELPQSDQGHFSRTCRSAWQLAAPILYKEIRLVLPGYTSADDRLILALEAFINAREETLNLVRDVSVSGFWYACFDEVESELGMKGIASPAVLMLNLLVTLLVRRLHHLDTFSWHCQVAPQAQLILALSESRLKNLTLTLSTDHSVMPYYFQPVGLHKFVNLRTIQLDMVDQSSVLDDLAHILPQSPHLMNLQVTLGHRLTGSPLTIFRNLLSKQKRLSLSNLDLQGFSEIDQANLWGAIDPYRVTELTIRSPMSNSASMEHPLNVSPVAGSRMERMHRKVPEEIDGFWEGAIDARAKIKTLYTDAVCSSLLEYIMSAGTVEHLMLLPSKESMDLSRDYLEPLIEIMLPAVGHRLSTLSLYSRDLTIQTFTLCRRQLSTIARHCPNLKALGIELRGNDVGILEGLFETSNSVEVLHIMPVEENQKLLEDHQEIAINIARLVARVQGPASRLKCLAVDSSDIFMIRRGKADADMRLERCSPKEWVTENADVPLFSTKVWEW